MTQAQRKAVHHGRVKMTSIQAFALAEGLQQLNVPPDAEVEIKMGLERLMEVRVKTADGLSLGQLECKPLDSVKITPLSPTA